MPTPLSRLQIRHFRLVHAIAETGQLSVAADRLGLTQPAASRMLSEIERMVGAPVFHRHPKGMTATPLGAVLLTHARTLLALLDHADSDVADFRSGRTGSVTIGAVTGAAVGYVVPAVRELKRDAPGAKFRVEVAPSVDLMSGLMNGDFDFVLSRVPPEIDPNRLLVHHGHVENLELLVRDTHPLLSEKGLTLDRLGNLPWVIQARGMPIREAVEQAYFAAGLVPPADVIDSASLLVMLAYLRGSDAISPVAREVYDLLHSTGDGGLRALDLKDPMTLTPYLLVQLRDRQLNPLAIRTREQVLKHLSA